MMNALYRVADALGPLPWSLGGSGLLLAHGLRERAGGDWDICVPVDRQAEVEQRLAPWGLKLGPLEHPAWRSELVGSIDVDGVQVEFLGGIAFRHEAGVYRMPFEAAADWWEVGGRRLPLAPLEEWFTLYLLMGRQETAAAIERRLAERPGAADRLRRIAGERELPAPVRERLLRAAGA
jgi:hypothetical protein